MFAALEAIAFKLNYCLSIQFSLGFLLLPNISRVALFSMAIMSSSGHNTSLIKINVSLALPEGQCMCVHASVHTHVNTQRCTCTTQVCVRTHRRQPANSLTLGGQLHFCGSVGHSNIKFFLMLLLETPW